MKIVGSLIPSDSEILIKFPVAFVAEPSFSVNFEMAADLGVVVDPVATFCSVTAWERNELGIAGAWILAGIACELERPERRLDLNHQVSFHYAFEGTAA